jgi:hypothetical protein
MVKAPQYSVRFHANNSVVLGLLHVSKHTDVANVIRAVVQFLSVCVYVTELMENAFKKILNWKIIFSLLWFILECEFTC